MRRVSVVEHRRTAEIFLGGRCVDDRWRIHERRERRWLAPLQLQDFRRLRLDPEIERQLAGPRGNEVTQHGTKAGALAERLVCLPDDGDIVKGVVGLAVAPLFRT